LKITLKDWTKKDDDRELYTRFDQCGFRGNGWLGKADPVDRSSFSYYHYHGNGNNNNDSAKSIPYSLGTKSY
jgi:hypothetical protein